MVWSCFPFIRSGQNHLARHSERGKKTRWTKEEVGRQHQGMERPGVRQVPEGSGEQTKMEKTGCKIICGAPTTLAYKGLMMMMKKASRRDTSWPSSCSPSSSTSCSVRKKNTCQMALHPFSNFRRLLAHTKIIADRKTELLFADDCSLLVHTSSTAPLMQPKALP